MVQLATEIETREKVKESGKPRFNTENYDNEDIFDNWLNNYIFFYCFVF